MPRDSRAGSLLSNQQRRRASDLDRQDDGSTDAHTVRVLSRLRKPKTRILHQEHRGVAAARNHGVRHARGQYIFPLDADDLVAPTLLEKGVAILESSPRVGFVSCGVRLIGDVNEDWPLPPYNFYRLLFREDHVLGSSLFRTRAWADAGGYNESMTLGCEDWDFWISLAERGWLGHTIPENLYYYRKHGLSRSSEAIKVIDQIRRQVRDNHPALYRAEALEEARRAWMPQVPPRLSAD